MSTLKPRVVEPLRNQPVPEFRCSFAEFDVCFPEFKLPEFKPPESELQTSRVGGVAPRLSVSSRSSSLGGERYARFRIIESLARVPLTDVLLLSCTLHCQKAVKSFHDAHSTCCAVDDVTHCLFVCRDLGGGELRGSRRGVVGI